MFVLYIDVVFFLHMCCNHMHTNMVWLYATKNLIGERAKRARHSQVCSIENRIYIYILLWYVQNFVLITRKEGGA